MLQLFVKTSNVIYAKRLPWSKITCFVYIYKCVHEIKLDPIFPVYSSSFIRHDSIRQNRG